MEQRLQKWIAAAGLCSRRTAEQWIAAGRVSVNGETALPGQKADPERDSVLLDGRPLAAPEHKLYLMLNKPRGYVCTLSDESGRPTVAELVRGCGGRVVPVGRLDLDSEGLLLLTNDGAWLQRLTHPKYEAEKTYFVKVAGNVRGAAERLARIREVGGVSIRPAQVRTRYLGAETAEFSITIHEGKNRQIRRMCEALDLHVKQLVRVKIKDLTLGDLEKGRWRMLSAEEAAALGG